MKEFVTLLFPADVVSLVGAVPKLEDHFQKNPVWKQSIQLHSSSSTCFPVGVIATTKLDIIDNCPIPKWISMEAVTECIVHITWTDHISVLPRLRHLCLINMVLNYGNIKSLLKLHLDVLHLKDCKVQGKYNLSLLGNPTTIKTIKCFGFCDNVLPLFKTVRCSKLITTPTSYFEHSETLLCILKFSPRCKYVSQELDKLSSFLPDLNTFVYSGTSRSFTFQKRKKWDCTKLIHNCPATLSSDDYSGVRILHVREKPWKIIGQWKYVHTLKFRNIWFFSHSFYADQFPSLKKVIFTSSEMENVKRAVVFPSIKIVIFPRSTDTSKMELFASQLKKLFPVATLIEQ